MGGQTAGPKAGAAGHGSHGEQDRPDRLGGAGAGRSLSPTGRSLITIAARNAAGVEL